MMSSYPTQPGTIITFYSYKGGTGRSMALANTACLLAQRLGSTLQKVLMMDWDLEAPGLHRFFSSQLASVEHADRLGIIDYFHTLRRLLRETEGLYEKMTTQEGWKVLDEVLPLDNYLISDVVAGLDLIKAGRFDPSYAERVGSFDWVEFYNAFGGVYETFRNLLISRYAYCLVDSRTGLTDISGVCTMLLPEKLVAVFTPNRQSLDGVLDLVKSAVSYRSASDDFRPLAVFPLPSRVELAEKTLKEEWRKDYQSGFEAVFRQVYGVEECHLTTYFDEVQLPHMSYYAYGENIAVREERSEALSLRRAYELFTRRLLDLSFAWEQSVSVQSVERPVFIEYVDFDIEVSLQGEGIYTVSTYGPISTIQEAVLLPTRMLEYQKLAARLYKEGIGEEGLKRIGQILFESLFQDQIKGFYLRSRSLLRVGQQLRIKLHISASDSQIAALPWELLYDPEQGYMSLFDTPIVRYLPISRQNPLPDASSSLSILLTGANPRTPLPTKVEQELSEIQTILIALKEPAQITVDPRLSTSKLQKLMRQRSFHIWHFVGHATSPTDSTNAVIALEDEKSLTEFVSAGQLSIMLSRSGLYLATLAADNSARVADDLSTTIPSALLRVGIPAIVGMQNVIQPESTRAFSKEFYRAMTEGHSIDTCMTEGRKAVVSAVGLGVADWSVPVLYTSVPQSWRLLPLT